MVNWHEVTPLSRILAIIVCVGIIPALFFYLGMQYQDLQTTKDVMHVYGVPRLENYTGSAFQAVPEAATSTDE